jgi:hypothetical protein
MSDTNLYAAIERADTILPLKQDIPENNDPSTSHFTGILLYDESSCKGIYTSLLIKADNHITYVNCFPGSYSTLAHSAGLVDAELADRDPRENKLGTDPFMSNKSLHISLKKYVDCTKIVAGKSVLIGAIGKNAVESYQSFVWMHTRLEDDED